MKKLFFAAAWIFCVTYTHAQTDTTFYYKENKILVKEQNGELKVQVVNDQADSAETVLFEGSYGEENSSEMNFNFTFGKLQKKKTHKKLYPHWTGIQLGFSSLATRDLHIANEENAALEYSSHEFGFHGGNFVASMSKRRNFMFFTGIGLRFHRYNADNNTVFRIVDNYVCQVAPPNNVFCKTSKLTAWYITVPAMIEWQKKMGGQHFYIQGGLEGGLRFFSCSKAKYIDNGQKTKEKNKKMNMNPVTLDIVAGFGYGRFGVYARYGLVSLFRAGRGTTIFPVSAGISWNF
ncbi:MAG: hypothetical protein LBH82_02705 [Bacteroidales bacterium]|jgi:hypothetical protein|nr:hypothetical protein [Bacteroidales bacterium]